MEQTELFGVICYAFLWLVYCGYNSYNTVNHERQLKKLQEMADNAHMYEIILQTLSPRAFMGLFVGAHLLVSAMELAGFALAYAYISFNEFFLFAFTVILVSYIAQFTLELRRIKKMGRIFSHSAHPFSVMARYLRFQLNSSPWVYLSTYGKCFIALQLFLNLLQNPHPGF